MQARLNEEFIVTVPISNEKAKVNTLSFDLPWEENMGLTNYLQDPMQLTTNTLIGQSKNIQKME